VYYSGSYYSIMYYSVLCYSNVYTIVWYYRV